jgi:hypothetical protein
LRKAGKDVHLAPKEFEILALLMEHRNVPLTHAKILRTIWGPGGTPEKAEWQRREDRTFFAGFDDRYAPDAAGGVDRRIGISGNGDVCRYSHGALNGCGQRRGPTMQSLKPTCIEHHHVGMRLDERRKLLRAVQEDWQIA